ncbi:response regulator transcription factor [Ferrovibrio xuzhouensis]|uniref:Response regulator transcription factor n=1 Tax=Ferrovibrio xuzhouensis TaxID=1576914 RepID=A0ABV7VLS7_9PROT
MSVERRREISILFGDPNRGMRMQYRAALRAEGFTQLHEFDTLENFPALCQKVQPDLIFMDAAMPEGNPADTVHDLRHGSLGSNPFVPIIIATWDASRSVVHRIIDCGADDVLIKPLSTQSISGRIQALADNRKPFVVTADYIGPDRRRSSRPSGGDPALLTVPNPLRAKLDGLPTGGDEFRRQVEDMRSQIGRLRLKAAAFRIAFVAAQMETIRQGAGEAGLMLLGSLLVSAEDMRGRLSGLQDHGAELALCDRLIETVQPLVVATDNRLHDGQNSAATIQSVAAVLLQTFHPERSGADLAADVAAAIGRYRARQEAVASGALQVG